MNVREIVKQELAKACAIPPEEVHDEGNLAEYGLDSMRSLELVVALETHFSIEIHDDDIAGMKTVGDVVAAIERGGKS